MILWSWFMNVFAFSFLFHKLLSHHMAYQMFDVVAFV